VKWHDGKPFTADDVVFTWEFARDHRDRGDHQRSYKDIQVEKIDQFTIRALFPVPKAVLGRGLHRPATA